METKINVLYENSSYLQLFLIYANMQLIIIIICKGKSMLLPEIVLVELAVLGVCHNQPLLLRKIVTVTKNIMPEIWNPTAEVIMSSIERCVSTGHLRINDAATISSPMIKISKAGKQQLKTLLLKDPGNSKSQSGVASEIMLMCLLDLVNADVAESVLVRIRERLQNQLSDFRQRSKKCLHVGQYTNLWFSIETRRLETSVHLLDLAYGKINRNHLTRTYISGS